MDKFFSLVINEYIKILKKLSTKILLAVLAVCVVGFSAIFVIAKHTAQSEMIIEYSGNYTVDTAIADYDSQIEWLNETKPDGYEDSIKLYEFMKANEIDYGDWRYSAAMSMEGSSYQEISPYLTTLAEDNWKDYCKLKLESGELSAGEKWAYAYRLEKNIDFTEEFSQQNEIIVNVSQAKDSLAYTNPDDKESRREFEEIIAIGTYQLDNEIYSNTADMMSIYELDLSEDRGFWQIFMLTPSLVTVAAMLCIIIAGGCVSGEFHQGTIKFLLINPVKRWKILMSKYFTVVTMGLALIAGIFILSIPVVGIMHGFDGISTPYLYFSDDKVQSVNSFLIAMRSYLVSSIEVIVMSTFAFAISSLIRSSALAIGASVFLMFAGSVVTQILAELGQDWGRFLIFSNLDLMNIYQGNSIFPQHTVFFAVMVLVAHMSVFILTAWDGFTKRSV